MNISKINTNIFKTNNVLNPNYIQGQTPKSQNSSSTDFRIHFKGDLDVSKAYAAPQINFVADKAKEIWKKIEEAENIVILTHKFADGDAASSGLVLLEKIEEKYPGKNVCFYVPGGTPSLLNGIPSIAKVSQKISSFDKIDLAIALDCDEINVDGYNFYEKASQRINIDHHATNGRRLKALSLVDLHASSVTEMLYNQLLKPLNMEINPKIAELILTGLITDTGNFKYNSSEDVLRMKEELLEHGRNDFSMDLINNKITENRVQSVEFKELYRHINARRQLKEFTTGSGDKGMCLTVPQKLLKSFGVKDSLPDLKSNFRTAVTRLLSYNDIGMLCWELPEAGSDQSQIVVSMRSRKLILSDFAKRYGGGGHAGAAGFTLMGELNSVKGNVLRDIREYKFPKVHI